MIGPFKRRKRDEHVLVAVPAATVHRQMLYDGMNYEVIPNLTELAGLSPVSPEVDEMERRDSEARLERISYLVPCLMSQASFMGQLSLQAQLKAMREAGVPYTEEDVEELAKAVLSLLHTTLISSVSTAVGLGLLEIPEVIREQL